MISEDLRKIVVDSHQVGKGYKTISEVFGVHQHTIRQMSEIQDDIYSLQEWLTDNDHFKSKAYDCP